MHTAPPARPSADLRRQARFVIEQLPPGGLFAGHTWRVAPEPFALGPELVETLQRLGRVLLQFYRAANLLYRHSLSGKQPEWVARWLDLGKPPELLALARERAFQNELPRVIRPDLLLTDQGLCLVELDSVPGGIGLTAWLNQVYTEAGAGEVIGGGDGMIEGFGRIFGEATRGHIVVSEESATYRPEMEWLAARLQERGRDVQVRDTAFDGFADGDVVYRFFELFDLPNVANASLIFDLARQKRLRVTPPPKPALEEKMLLALLWNRNLREYWRRELGESFFLQLQKLVPYSWVVDPTPLPPHGAIPQLDLTDWQQLKTLSQRERQLILKVSGFSAQAWGARGVYLGSDLPLADWAAAVDRALTEFNRSPYVLQRYYKPASLPACYYDPGRDEMIPFQARVRLCPYYFVWGEGDAARAHLGGVLATLCPADKKLIHGMSEAVLIPAAP